MKEIPKKDIEDLVNAGHSVRSIARELSVSAGQIELRLKKYGLKTNTQKRRESLKKEHSCAVCGYVFKEGEGYFKSGRKKGYCDPCNLSKRDQWRKENPEKQRAQARKWMRDYYRRKPEVIMAAQNRYQIRNLGKYPFRPETIKAKLDFIDEYEACKIRRGK